MLARHDGQVVLVAGAIPGERVTARVSRVVKGVAFADTVTVETPSPDRRVPLCDWRCGGSVFAHVTPARQAQLKAAIVDDAFRRIARAPLPALPEVVPSPERGYRSRARLHVQGSRIGFLRESSHELCDAAGTGQLAPATESWVVEATRALEVRGLRGLKAIELAEDVPGTQRVCHLELASGETPGSYQVLHSGLTGLTASVGESAASNEVSCLHGTGQLQERIVVTMGETRAELALTRDVRAFFQGNRFLLEPLVNTVVSHVPEGPVLDLYAGVGLFGLSLAAAGWSEVTLVEGDPVSGRGLVSNAAVHGARARAHLTSVEQFLSTRRSEHREGTVILDPPRTGVSRDALPALVARRARRIVYVSCDVATLARDSRGLFDSGYALTTLTAFDLFPNTAHVECLAVFERG